MESQAKQLEMCDCGDVMNEHGLCERCAYTRCGRCGRPLKTVRSQMTGFGDRCRKIVEKERMENDPTQQSIL